MLMLIMQASANNSGLRKQLSESMTKSRPSFQGMPPGMMISMLMNTSGPRKQLSESSRPR
jgi:hypothetical protein